MKSRKSFPTKNILAKREENVMIYIKVSFSKKEFYDQAPKCQYGRLFGSDSPCR